MAIIKLTDVTWLELEAAKVAGALKSTVALGGSEGRAGKDSSTLRAMLEYVGLKYTDGEIGAIRDKLVVDGVIEII